MVGSAVSDATLVDLVGTQFLSYLLNVPENDLSERRDGHRPMAADRERVLTALSDRLTEAIDRADDETTLTNSLGEVARFDPQAGLAWATATRIALGGTIEIPPGGDPASDALVALARDAYPVVLLPPAWLFAPSPPPRVAALLDSHPGMEEFTAAVGTDAALSRLLPIGSGSGERYGRSDQSTGQGGGLSSRLLVESLLSCAWTVVGRELRLPSVAEYAGEVLNQLSIVRRVVEGEPVDVLALVGVTGARLDDGVEVALPWGRLREMRSADQVLVPLMANQERRRSSEDDGPSIEINLSGDLIMEIKVPYLVVLERDEEARSSVHIIGNQDVTRCEETLRLGLLLSEGHELPPLSRTWLNFVDPLATIGSVSSRDSRRLPPALAARLISKDEARRWERWVGLIAERRGHTIETAIRRTILASAERFDPQDALVDAVIAWESLFGSGNEVTLRIATSMAWLLGRDPNERLEVESDVREVYGVRSAIVHGRSLPNIRKVDETRVKALDLTLRALRRLFEDRPDLLVEGVKAKERGQMLMLATGPT